MASESAISVKVQRWSELSEKPEAGRSISVVSFNLLASCYVRVPNQPWNAYAWCDAADLDWKRREPLISQLLSEAKADVICLQELEYEEHKGKWGCPSWLKDWTAEKNYFVQLQNISPPQMQRMAARNERVIGKRSVVGMAIVYRSDRLREVTVSDHQGRSMVVHLESTADAKDSADGLVSGTRVSIANVHLEAVAEPGDAYQSMSQEEKDAFDTRRQSSIQKQLSQMQSVLQCLTTRHLSHATHFIVCGDFNCECLPHQPLAQLLTKFTPPLAHLDLGATYTEPSGTPMALDHVWVSRSLGCVRHSDLMSADVKKSGLPSSVWPSDHLPLGVVLTEREAAAVPPRAVEPKTVSEERKTEIEREWIALEESAPEKVRGKPSPEALAALQAHAAKKKTWQQSLTVAERGLVVSLSLKQKSKKK